MGFGSNEIGLLFRCKGDTDDAKNAFQSLKTSINNDVDAIDGKGRSGFSSLASSIGLSESSATKLGAAMPFVGAAVAATAGVIVAAGISGVQALFNLTKSAADFGSEIFDAKEKTGLTAETLSAMKFAADQSGTSLDAITAASSRFAKTIGEAANGSEKAQEKLGRLGVTSKDLDTALGQALATIVKLPPGVQQMTAAQDAFGRSGADLLPFIKSFDGDLVALTQKAKDLGVTMTDEAAASADEFGDQMDTLSAQVAGVGRTVGIELIPVFLSMAKTVSGWIAQNKTEIATYSQVFGIFVGDVLRGLGKIKDWVSENIEVLDVAGRILSAIATGGTSEIGRYVGGQYGENIKTRMDSGAGNQDAGGGSPSYGYEPPSASPRGSGGREKAGSDTTADGKKAEKEREDRKLEELERKRVADARQHFEDETAFFAAEAKKRYAVAVEYARVEGKTEEQLAKFKEQLDEDVLKVRMENLKKFFQQLIPGTEAYKRTQQEIRILELSIETDRAESSKKQQDRDEKNRKTQEETRKFWADEIAASAKRIENSEAEYQAIKKRQEDEAQAKADKKKEDEKVAYGPFQDLIDGYNSFLDLVNSSAPTLSATLQGVAGLFVNAFQGMSQAIGGLVQQWVLMGTTGPAVMRKILASALASIAAEAAVRAVWELGLGFATLFLNPSESAGHFIAAGIFGGIAVGAGLAGRAIAGDSFKRETGGNFGAQEPSNRNASGQGDGNAGGVYSSQKDATYDVGRNAPSNGIGGLTLTINDKSDWFAQMFKIEMEKNGMVRQLVLDAG